MAAVQPSKRKSRAYDVWVSEKSREQGQHLRPVERRRKAAKRWKTAAPVDRQECRAKAESINDDNSKLSGDFDAFCEAQDRNGIAGGRVVVRRLQ